MATRYSDYLAHLQHACDFFQVERGRASLYQGLIAEFFEGRRTDKNALALNESMEIYDLHCLWRNNVDRFPGLQKKIQDSISKGPILTEQENPATSTNRPRNNAFVFVLAGYLLSHGVEVQCVEGVRRLRATCHTDADITISCANTLVDIQAKRPRSRSSLQARTKDAVRQIRDCPRPDQLGVVAVDVSVVIRPTFSVLEDVGAERAYDQIGHELKNTVAQSMQRHITPRICSSLVFARVPSMIREPSSILSASGEPFSYVTPFSVTSLVAVANDDCARLDIGTGLAKCIKAEARHLL